MSDVQSLDGLIEALRRLPGVGIKSAQRMAFHLLQRDQDGARQLARALTTAVESVTHCERCHTFTEGRICSICQDEGRDAARLCVVEAPADMADRKSTRLNSSHLVISYAVFCLKKKKHYNHALLIPETSSPVAAP